MVSRHEALAREEIIEALTAWTGITSADGATPGNNTLIDSLLIGKNDFISGKTILIGGGFNTSYEDRGAQSFDNITGTITFTSGFSAQIKAGTIYRVLNLSSAAQVSALLNAIKAKTDNLPAAPANEVTSLSIKTQTDTLPRKVSTLSFWCHPAAAKITVTTPAVDIDFPDIVVAGLPTGLSLVAVRLVLAVAHIKNTNAAANYINAANKRLRVKPAAGTWPLNSVIGLTLANQALYTSASGERGGPVFQGPDIKASINQDGTYNVRSDQTNFGEGLVAAAASLELYDVDVGLLFYFK